MIVARSIRFVVLVLAAGILAGCYDASDPDVYPLRFELDHSSGGYQRFADLDGDGRDEMFAFVAHAAEHGHVGVLLQELDGVSIEQVNMATAYRRAVDERLHALDLDGDGRLEVLVPLIRGDSLVVRAYDADARFVRELFLTTGQPRQAPHGEISWDPVIRGLYLEDVHGDVRPELLVVVRTGYARYPRGVLALDLQTGDRVGEWLSGASLRGVSLEDVDGDGHRELLFESGASRNGASAGGFSDDLAHAGVVDVQTPMRLIWSATGDRRRYSGFIAGSLGRGRVLLAEAVGTARPGPSRVAVADAATGRVLRERMWPYGVRTARVATNGPVWLQDMQGHIFSVDKALDVIAERWMEASLGQPLDLDADGVDELVVHQQVAGQRSGHAWLDAELKVKAVMAGESAAFTLAQQGAGRRPLLARYSAAEGTPRTYLYAVEPNPWWWVHRYGPGAALCVSLFALCGLAVASVQWTHRRRLAEAVRERVLAGEERGILLLDPVGDIAELNSAFRQRFGLNGQGDAPLRRALEERAPALAGFLSALTEAPPHRREAAVEAGGDDAPPTWVVAEPLEVGRGRPYWLVSVAPPPAEPAAADATWPLLARRVVHDLKNPLTSILLTLQRMQMEAHAHAQDEPAGDLAVRLDPYVERVEGRVEHLRRLAQNLLKFLDAASPELAETGLCAVVERCVEEIRPAMPPDVRLALRRCSEPVPVLCDAEQVASALENLVMNAVQAMPEGGRVTVQARVARRLQPEGAPAPRDYAVLEVLDTGRGMDAEARRRAFEPGFTTRDGGTGLGLALVRKIVADHGGFATVESEPGAGTAVCLHVPLASHGSLAARTPDAPTATRDAAAA